MIVANTATANDNNTTTPARPHLLSTIVEYCLLPSTIVLSTTCSLVACSST